MSFSKSWKQLKMFEVGGANTGTRLTLNWRTLGSVILSAAVVVCILLPYYTLPPLRVGDGSEYYAMLLALKQEHHPWLTARSLDLYEALISTHSISAMIPTKILYESFPALRFGATFDFNHFWMYSLLAAGVSSVAGFFGLALTPHHAFLTLHVLLTVGVVLLAKALFGWRGVVTSAAITLLSPMIWFIDKVHTEYFTHCTVLAAVMLAQRRYLAWSAAFLALASTQNPSFAIVALALLIWRLASIRRAPLHFWDLCAVVATVLLALVHPAYYYFRHGVLTPQMLAGGAELGGNARNFYVWLLDPDLGLLPNWPLGVALLLIAGTLTYGGIRQRRLSVDWPLVGFIAGFTLVNLLAQSSTTNMNSGATPGLARYALWYIPLFFPLALRSVEWLDSLKFGKKVIAVAAAVAYAAANAVAYNPRLAEEYLHPSTVSKFIQKRLPGLYDPPVEIFVERYSGLDENAYVGKVSAVIGPSCDKLLILPNRDANLIGNSSKCLIDDERIGALIEEVSLNQSHASYVRLPAEESAGAIPVTPFGRIYLTARGKSGMALLGDGWHQGEAWGTWAESRTAQLNIPCPRDAGEFNLALTLTAFRRNREATVQSKNEPIWSGDVMTTPTRVVVPLTAEQCAGGSARLALVSSSAETPKSLGLSMDERALGLGLIEIQYER